MPVHSNLDEGHKVHDATKVKSLVAAHAYEIDLFCL
jgi:hypothetical protein